MGFVAKESTGGNFKRVPSGAFIGRCIQLIDLGTQETVFQGEAKAAHKIRVVWELFGEDTDGSPLTVQVDGRDMPLTISKNYTVSLHEKASLRKDLAAWRGRDFTPEEAKAFDVSKLLGSFCMVNVTESDGANGKTYSNVAGLTPLPGALKNNKPAGVHQLSQFDLDNPDMALFETFHEKLQDQIRSAPEWSRAAHRQVETASVGDDDIPF
jgi:hypothetical protein